MRENWCVFHFEFNCAILRRFVVQGVGSSLWWGGVEVGGWGPKWFFVVAGGSENLWWCRCWGGGGGMVVWGGGMGVATTSYLLAQISFPESFYFGLKTFRNKLPTKDNFAAHDIISHDSQLCVTDCRGLETGHHLFLFCLCPSVELGQILDGHLISRSVLSYGSSCFVCWLLGGTQTRRSFM